MNSTTPPDSRSLMHTFLTILVLGFSLLTPLQTQAKRVKIQPNIYQKVLKNRTKNPTVNKIVQSAFNGKICYVGKIEDVKNMSNKINQAMGMHFVTWKAIERNQSDSYYKPFYNAVIKSVSNDEISYKNRQHYWIYYIYGNTSVVQSCKNRKRYWSLAKKSVRKAGVRNGMSDEEAVKRITKWICKHTTYVAGGIDNCKNGTLFINGRGVCRDYADAMWSMCRICNIKCSVIAGTAAGGYHAWNKVKIKGKWYWIDSTWMDGNTINYKYYKKRKLWGTHRVRYKDVKYALYWRNYYQPVH